MSRHRTSAGMALLFAIIAVALVSAALVAGLAGASEAIRSLRCLERERALRHLLKEGETLAAQWACDQGPRMVLAPDAGGVLIVDDRFTSDGEPAALRVVMCDAHATPAVESVHELGSWLPSTHRFLPHAAATTWDALALPSGVVRFPDPEAWPGHAIPWSITSAIIPSPQPAAPRCDLFMVANPGGDRQVNLNTAPTWLLQALAGRGLIGDVETILTVRRRGERWEVPPNTDPAAQNLQPVITTDRWCALVSASHGTNRRTWCVLLVGNHQGCRMVGRYDADP